MAAGGIRNSSTHVAERFTFTSLASESCHPQMSISVSPASLSYTAVRRGSDSIFSQSQPTGYRSTPKVSWPPMLVLNHEQ